MLGSIKPSNRQHKLKNCPVCRKVLVASSLYLHMKVRKMIVRPRWHSYNLSGVLIVRFFMLRHFTMHLFTRIFKTLTAPNYLGPL